MYRQIIIKKKHFHFCCYSLILKFIEYKKSRGVHARAELFKLSNLVNRHFCFNLRGNEQNFSMPLNFFRDYFFNQFRPKQVAKTQGVEELQAETLVKSENKRSVIRKTIKSD